MSEDMDRRLRLMRFWLFGTFLLLWAISSTYYFMYLAPISDVITVVTAVWPVWAVAAVGAIAVYYFYRWWLGRGVREMAPAAPDSAAPPFSEPSGHSQVPESAAPPTHDPPSYSQSDEG